MPYGYQARLPLEFLNNRVLSTIILRHCYCLSYPMKEAEVKKPKGSRCANWDLVKIQVGLKGRRKLAGGETAGLWR